MTRHIGRANVRKRLAPLDGRPGRSVYAGGVARFEPEDGEPVTVRPPFGLEHEAEHDRVRVSPLLEELERDRVVAVLLARLGGSVAGVLDGERVVASKVTTRFVKGRHKKGGSSSNRFRRRRGEQEREFADAAAAAAAETLGPWRDRAAHVALGGDKRAGAAVLDARPELEWLRERALRRFFVVPEPRLRDLERLPYDLYAAEVEEG